MFKVNEPENVKNQYANGQNLSARINLHAKHSTNKQGLVTWLFEQYKFSENFKILELGCGNAEQWNGHIGDLPNGCELILSDFSRGMVESVKEKYSKYSNVSFAQVDIQNINYPSETFDIVIANHML